MSRRRVALLALLSASASCAPHEPARTLLAPQPPPPSASASAISPQLRVRGAAPDGSLKLEGEDFTPHGPGWARGEWGDNYYANTFGNSFLSGKAFLGAPAQCHACRATLSASVRDAGDYVPLVRYEAPYRFGSAFRLQIAQGGKTVFDHLYGGPESLRVFPFGKRRKHDAPYAWGATENEVWEGDEQRVRLEPGNIELTLLAEDQAGDAAARNVDVVFLTRDAKDVQHRIASEAYLPLDGLLTQAGDVSLRVNNHGGAMTLTVPPGIEHGPYWVHQRTWSPLVMKIAAGETTEWAEVGHLLDSLNDGQWDLSAKSEEKKALDFSVEMAVFDASGARETIAVFPQTSADLPLVYDASTTTTRRVRRADDLLFELLGKVRSVPVHGTPPTSTLVYSRGFDAVPGDEPRNYAITELNRLLGVTAPLNDPGDPLTTARNGMLRGYLVAPWASQEALTTACAQLKAKGGDPTVRVISVGDEISIQAPPGSESKFSAWLRERNVTPKEIGKTSLKEVNPEPFDLSKNNAYLHYLSELFAGDMAIAREKERTEQLHSCYPNALVGANFSPHGSIYLGTATQWITLFRRGALTMPWTEDYVWTMPVASQQMSELPLDVLSAGMRGSPSDELHEYVMPHTPGNTPDDFRRQLYAAWMHGAKVLNLFEARPTAATYTENSVNDPLMFGAIRTGLHELGLFDELVQSGSREETKIALWYSRAGEIHGDDQPPFGAGKRTLWLALRHLGFSVDIVDEEDALAGRLVNYRAIYLTEKHVSKQATSALASWVSSGGRLFVTAGAGSFDEADKPNYEMRVLTGVDASSVQFSNEEIRFEKQDLPFATPLASMTPSLQAFGALAHFVVGDAHVADRFADGSPSVALRDQGTGHVISVAMLPGLAYVAPALPRVPVDRTPHKGSSSHFLPTAFSLDALRLVQRGVGELTPEVRASDPLVEAVAIKAPRGMVIGLVSWRSTPILGLTIDVEDPSPRGSYALASGRPLLVTEGNGVRHFRFDLDVADALILR